MVIKSKMLFILIGDDRTGKTTLQKLLIERLTSSGLYEKLPTNLAFDITHPEIKRKYRTISFGNRSYQEKIGEYVSVENYFASHFKDRDIAFISSHLVEADVRNMITQGRRRFYNVIGVFWSNSISGNGRNNDIAQLDWNERLIIENPASENETQIANQLNKIADNIVIFIANRTSIS